MLYLTLYLTLYLISTSLRISYFTLLFTSQYLLQSLTNFVSHSILHSLLHTVLHSCYIPPCTFFSNSLWTLSCTLLCTSLNLNIPRLTHVMTILLFAILNSHLTWDALQTLEKTLAIKSQIVCGIALTAASTAAHVIWPGIVFAVGFTAEHDVDDFNCMTK